MSAPALSGLDWASSRLATVKGPVESTTLSTRHVASVNANMNSTHVQSGKPKGADHGSKTSRKMRRNQRESLRRAAAARQAREAERARLSSVLRAKLRNMEHCRARGLKYSSIMWESSDVSCLSVFSYMLDRRYSTRKQRRRDCTEVRAMHRLQHVLQPQAGLLDAARGAYVGVSERVADAVNGVKKVCTDSATIVDGVARASKAFGDVAEEMFSMMKTIKEQIVKWAPEIFFGAFVIGIWFWCLSQRYPPMWFTLLGGVASTMLGHQAYTYLTSRGLLPTEVPDVTNDVIEPESGLGSGVSPIVMALLSYFMISTNVLDPNSFNTTKILKSVAFLGCIPKASDGLEKLLEWTVLASEKIVNWVRSLLSLPEIRFRAKLNEQLDNLVDEVNALERLYITDPVGPIDNAHTRMTKLNGLMYQAIDLRKVYSGDRNAISILSSCQRTLVALAKPLRSALGADSGLVQQPVSVVLYGQPGVGKTMIMQALSMTILRQLGELTADMAEEGGGKLIFSKPHNSEYMEGYCGQPVYVIDDFMAKKATPSDVSTGITDLMTYYTSFSTMVNMAACENKGMWPFMSKLMLITTNMQHTGQVNAGDVYLNMDAIERRVDFHFEFGVRPGYSLPDGKLDYEKFQEEARKLPTDGNLLQRYPWHIWEVWPTKWTDQSFPVRVPGTGSVLTTAVLDIVRKIQARSVAHQETVALAKNIMNAEPLSASDIEALIASTGTISPQSGDVVNFGSMTQDVVEEIEEMTSCGSFEGWTSAGNADYAVLLDNSVDRVHVPDDERPPRSKAGKFAMDWLDAEERDLKRKLRKESTPSGMWDFLFPKPGEPPSFTQQIVGGAIIGAVMPLCIKSILAVCKFVGDILMSVKNFFFRMLFGTPIETQSNGPVTGSVKHISILPQSDEDVRPPELVDNVYRNTFKMVVRHSTGAQNVLGQVLFLKRDYCVMPGHYVKRVRKSMADGLTERDAKILLISCRSPDHVIQLTAAQLDSFPMEFADGKDLVYVRLRGVHFTSRDITHFLLEDDEIPKIGGQPVRLDVAKYVNDGFTSRAIYSTPSVKYIGHERLVGEFRQKTLLNYVADTYVGDCGAVLCLKKASLYGCRIVAGMHIGSGSKLYGEVYTAYATPLGQTECNAMIMRLAARTKDPIVSELTFDETCELAKIDANGCQVSPHEVLPVGEPDEDGNVHFGSFENVAITSKALSAPVKTGFVETFVSGEKLLEQVLPDYSLRPVKLSPYLEDGGPVFPMEEAMRPYAGDVHGLDTNLVRKAIHIAMLPLSGATVNVPGRTWSPMEALVGAEGAKSMPLGTSAGFPGCLKFGNKRKALGDIVDWESGGTGVDEFLEQLSALDDLLHAGTRPCFVARGFLKDELRKPGKGARYIAGTNMHYYALCRKYFGQVVTAQMNQYKACGICPGINPYADWEWLTSWITEKGDKVWDGDFSGFDTSQQPQFLLGCLDWINEWYTSRGGGEDNGVREILFTDLYKSLHLCGLKNKSSHIVQWQRSLPSGHFLTSFINSMVSMSCIVAAYIVTTGREDFWDKVRVAVLGDDNVVNASDDVIDQFNQVSVAKVLKDEFNMVYTAGRKGEALQPYLSLEDITFLQRRFTEKYGKKVGPIRLESVYGPLLYAQRGDEKYMRDVMCSNIEGALCELSLHHESLWEQGSQLLREIAARLNYVPMRDISTSRDYFDFTCSQLEPKYSL